MARRVFLPTLTLLLSTLPTAGFAQNALPTSQPTVLTIFREDVKYGHNADHEKLEAGWPAALTKAKAPATYIAMTSMTGANEAWFIAPYANWKGVEDELKFEGGSAALSTELGRLSKADAEHVTAGRAIHLIGRPELSAGTFPNVGKIRFYEITWFRVRPGHEGEFEQLAKVYGTAFKKVMPQGSYRTYQVVAGVPGPTFMIFSSAQSLADFDQSQSMDAAVFAQISPEDQKAFQKFALEGTVNTETQRFAMNGPMSYVDEATIAQDPAFWRPKPKPAAKATATN